MAFPCLFFKLCLVLSCGIAAGCVLPAHALPVCCALGGGLCVLLVVLHAVRHNVLFGVAHGLCLLCAGAVLACLERAEPVDAGMRWAAEQRCPDRISYAGVVAAEPAVRSRTVKLKLQLRAAGTCDSLYGHPFREQVLLYVARDTLSASIRQGDLLVWQGALEPIDFVRDGFDYGAYMRRYAVFRNGFVKADGWRHAASGCLPLVRQMPADCRYRLLGLLRHYRLQRANYDVVAALTLGYREGLDEDLEQSFASAGAMHVLAVSGLHVGVLYALCGMLLAPLRRVRGGRAAAFWLLTGFLWMVALVTGFSPSVTRAVTMCTFVAVGAEMRRITVTWNAVAVSAFLLLCYRPMWLFEAGFQLSYGAVLSILWLYGPLQGLYRPRSGTVRRAWSLACVSLAAQIGVLPLSLYYFHQFPVYFLLSGFVAIPCATCILYLTLCLMCVALAGWTPLAGGRLLDGVAGLLNHSVRLVERLPCALVDNIAFSGTDLILTILTGFCLAVGLYRRRMAWIALALLLVIGWNCRTLFRG